MEDYSEMKVQDKRKDDELEFMCKRVDLRVTIGQESTTIADTAGSRSSEHRALLCMRHTLVSSAMTDIRLIVTMTNRLNK